MKLLSIFTLVTILLTPIAVNSQTSDSYKWNEARRSVAETDVVAYFSLGAGEDSVAGKEEFSYPWEGFTWQFSSQENLDLFKAAPEKYIPQFGGYCAFAVSKGYTATIDPDAWTVHDGKLYVNYSKGVRTTWLKDRDERIVKGNENWPGLKQEL